MARVAGQGGVRLGVARGCPAPVVVRPKGICTSERVCLCTTFYTFKGDIRL